MPGSLASWPNRVAGFSELEAGAKSPIVGRSKEKLGLRLWKRIAINVWLWDVLANHDCHGTSYTPENLPFFASQYTFRNRIITVGRNYSTA
jgi:hypothetical protein